MYSHNQIVDLLQRIARDHWQIKSMGFGDIAEMSSNQLLYTVDSNNPVAPTFPLMWGIVKQSQLLNNPLGASELQKTYTIIVCDKLKSDSSNVDEILSDCEQICLDVIAILQDGSFNDYFFVDKSAILTPYQGLVETDDGAVAWMFDITFRQSYSNRCAVPAAIPSPIPIS